MDNMENFFEFVQSRAGSVIGNGMLGSAIIVFEFINEKGQLCYSVLRPMEVSWADTAELLLNAADTFAQNVAEGGLPQDLRIEIIDEDDLFNDGDDDDIDYK